MPRPTALALALVVLFTATLPAHAQVFTEGEGYVGLGGGYGGKEDAVNLSFEFGALSTGYEHNLLFGIGMSGIASGNVPDDTLDYPVPHDDYELLGTRQSDEGAIFGKFGLETIPDSRVFITALGGVTFFDEVELARSNATGWYYEQSSDTKARAMYGAGAAWFPARQTFGVQVEYDNRRGVTAMVTIRF